MRTSLASLLLALFALAVRAQEGAERPGGAAGDATAQLPKGAPACFRIASFDRVDAIVNEWVPMLKAMGLGEQVAPLEQMPASNFLFMLSGLNADIVDRTKPIHVGLLEDDKFLVVLHPAAGAAWEGKKELREGAFAVLRGGAIVAGEGGLLDTEARGTPTTFRVEGDAVLHVYLGDLIAAHKEDIEQAATEAAMGVAAMGQIPEEARALILPIVTSVKNGILSVEAFDYGLSWTGERLETEGFVTVAEGSGLRNLLKRAGEPGSTDLAAYLPKEAYMTVTACMNPDWPTKELKEVLEKAGGAEVATALMQVLSMGSAFDEARTGRTAVSVNMNMMAMAMSITTLAELKPGVDGAKVVEAMDFTKINESLKKIGIPMGYTFTKNVGKHGETDLHRFGMTSEDGNMAMMFAMMQGCMAIDKGILFMTMSATGDDDMKILLDKVNRGEKIADHPHTQAMARLGRGHNIGFTFNLGALKPMGMMLGMFAPGTPPEVTQAIQNMPDVLPLSTAITFPDGNIRWRGDWPVKEVAKVAETIRKAMPEAKPPAPEGEGPEGDDEDEKFD